MANLNLSADEVLTTTRAVRKRLDLDRPVKLPVLRECLEIALLIPCTRGHPANPELSLGTGFRDGDTRRIGEVL